MVRDGDLLIEFGRSNFQDKCEPHHSFERDHALAAFDSTYILPVKVAKLSQPLLGEFAGLPHLLQLSAEQNQCAGHAIGSCGGPLK